METRPLGTSDIEITPVIMGTWQAGKSMWTGIDDSHSTGAIQAAFDTGINTFDTAEGYGGGHSERILGSALGHVRAQVIYATKVSPNHLKYDQVIAACHRSLKNLKTDYIDLYQIHWPAGSWGGKKVPIQETMQAMTDLKEQGKIRALGVSNFSRVQLEEASRCVTVQSIQPPYSLFWRHIEQDIMPYCLENRITILAYAPMAQGLLSGKFRPDHRFSKKDNRARNRLFQGKNMERAQGALTRLRPLAERKGMTLAQLALSWVISQPGICAIAGARQPEQALENARTVDFHLSGPDLEELNAIGRIVTGHLDDNPVLWDV